MKDVLTAEPGAIAPQFVAIESTLEETIEPGRNRVSAFDLMAAQPWAIQPETLETIARIARREHEGPEAVAAKLGRPLQNARTVTVRDGVAIIPVTGPIFRYANLFTEISGATSLEVLARDFSAAQADPLVKSVVLEINSPGGQVSGIAEMAHMIRAAAKPVIAYVDGMAASAGYWLAAAAREVVINKTSQVGSIGAVLGISGRARDGVIEIVSSQSPKKRPDAATNEGRAQLQAQIDALAQVFIEDVAAYRGVSVESVLSDFGQGDIKVGAAAVTAGMADRVSTLEEVIAGLAGTTIGANRMSTVKASGAPAAEQPVITREYLEANHADLMSAILSEGKTAGATAERERIQSVLAQSLPGHEALVNTLAFDGKTTGAEAAVAVLNAERGARKDTLAGLRADSPKPLPQPAGDDAAAEATLPIEERCKAKWDRSAELRAEFNNNFGTYLAFTKAEEAGTVRVLRGKA
ncbi:MAG: S49 family peptidase [Bradyrhizobium sp.]|uniref:S49 family peptidase n=1 Tax=Bradyrhizobium sp. TaxID=376 RepID=UPI003D14A158